MCTILHTYNGSFDQNMYYILRASTLVRCEYCVYKKILNLYILFINTLVIFIRYIGISVSKA